MDKKDIRNQIEAKLETVFTEFSKGLSEKKFKKHIKKAGKILSEGLVFPVEKVESEPAKKANGKKTVKVKVKKAAKKVVVKKAAPVKKGSQPKENAQK